MRLLALLAVLAAGATAGPPRIHEPFTALPCPAKPLTTLDLEGCSERRILRSDAAIDAAAARIFSLLQPAGRAPFSRGETAWLAYRRATCAADASRFAGGSAEPVAFGVCEEARNAAHLRELAALEHDLRTH